MNTILQLSATYTDLQRRKATSRNDRAELYVNNDRKTEGLHLSAVFFKPTDLGG